MATHTIAVIPGDGVGQEVIPEGLKTLRVLQDIVPGLHMEFEEFPWGSEYYLAHGSMMPDSALKTLTEFDAIYFGAVGDPQIHARAPRPASPCALPRRRPRPGRGPDSPPRRTAGCHPSDTRGH